jgi:hypothetical protein
MPYGMAPKFNLFFILLVFSIVATSQFDWPITQKKWNYEGYILKYRVYNYQIAMENMLENTFGTWRTYWEPDGNQLGT